MLGGMTLPSMTGPTQVFTRPVQFSSRQQIQRAATVPAPPVQVVHHSSALFSTNSIRPHVNPAIPPIRNLVASELRAPAPHLQPFRPASSVSATSLPPLTGVMLPQQSFSSSATTSVVPPLPAPPPPLPMMHSSGTFSRMPQSEAMSGLPIFNNSPQSTLEPLTDMGNHPSGNPSANVLPPLQGLNFDTWDMSQPAITGALRSSVAQAGSAGDVVCVSDDDD